jgi:chromosome segregation ATPase
VVEKKNEQLEQRRDHLAAKRVEVENLERILGNMNTRVARLEKDHQELSRESERKITQLEQLVEEYRGRIAELEEAAVLNQAEAGREVTRWKGKAHYLEQSLESIGGHGRSYSVKLGHMQEKIRTLQDEYNLQQVNLEQLAANRALLQEKMLNLLDKYNLQQSHLERMAADRALYMERYTALLQTLDELAGWGNR